MLQKIAGPWWAFSVTNIRKEAEGLHEISRWTQAVELLNHWATVRAAQWAKPVNSTPDSPSEEEGLQQCRPRAFSLDHAQKWLVPKQQPKLE